MRSLRLLAKRLCSSGLGPIIHSRRWLPRIFLRGEGLRTLDLGCGSGYYTLAAAQRGGYALGISHDERALKEAAEMRDFLGLSERQVEFRFGDLRTWEPGPGEQYDQILLLAVLEHLLDDAGLLQRVHAALKPGGLIYVSTPNRACGPRDRHEHVTRDETGWHVRHGYTFEQLEALLTQCGYEPIDRRGLGWFGAQTVARAMRALRMPRSVSLGVHSLLFPIWKPIAILLDLVPIREPYCVMVIARKGVAP